jgi:hypothetical protein
MFNPKLPPAVRMRQFDRQRTWAEHIDGHFQQLECEEAYARKGDEGGPKSVRCPDPRCALCFDQVQELWLHGRDIHSLERTKHDPAKRPRLESIRPTDMESDFTSSSACVARCKTPNDRSQLIFVNTTAESFVPCPIPTVENSPAGSDADQPSSMVSSTTFRDSPSMTQWPYDEAASAAETPASSVYSDDLLPFIDPQLVGKSIAPQPILHSQ